jgi:hypothetical protein
MSEYKSPVLTCHAGDDDCPICRFLEGERSEDTLLAVVSRLDGALAESQATLMRLAMSTAADFEEGLAMLLDIIAGRLWPFTGGGLASYPKASETGGQKLHAACLELERRGLIHRQGERDDVVIWRADVAELLQRESERRISVRLPRSLHESLRREAAAHLTSMNELCLAKLSRPSGD